MTLPRNDVSLAPASTAWRAEPRCTREKPCEDPDCAACLAMLDDAEDDARAALHAHRMGAP